MYLENILAMETRQDLQLRLQYELRQNLEAIKDITTTYINRTDILKKEILEAILGANDRLNKDLLEMAIELDIKFNKGLFRESGDPEVTHHFQAGYGVADTGGNSERTAGAIHHDSIEKNRDRKNIVLNEIHGYLGPEVMYLVLGHTNIEEIEDPELKKAYISQKIKNESSPKQRTGLSHIRVCERISNLLSLDGLGYKKGRTAEERSIVTINDTIKETLGLALEVDRACMSRRRLKLYPLLVDILVDDAVPNILSLNGQVYNDKARYEKRRLSVLHNLINGTLPLAYEADRINRPGLKLAPLLLEKLRQPEKNYNLPRTVSHNQPQNAFAY